MATKKDRLQQLARTCKQVGADKAKALAYVDGQRQRGADRGGKAVRRTSRALCQWQGTREAKESLLASVTSAYAAMAESLAAYDKLIAEDDAMIEEIKSG